MKKLFRVLALRTKGYSLAFQTVGYHYWNALCHNDFNKIDTEEIEREIRITLSELSYEKILNELSANDLKVLRALITISEKDQNESVKVEDVRNCRL